MDGRGRDDRRMHEGRKPGLEPGNSGEHDARDEQTPADRDGEPDSALGGGVATRTGSTETPEAERTG